MRRDGVQRARTTLKRCPLFDPACAAAVAQHVGAFYPQPFDAAALLETQCGRYTRGVHAGQLRGWAEVEVVTEGGWKRSGPGERNGRVVRPGQVLSVRVTAYDGRPYLEVAR